MKKLLPLLIFIFICCSNDEINKTNTKSFESKNNSSYENKGDENNLYKEDILTILEKSANWQLNKWDKSGYWGVNETDWVNATAFCGLLELAKISTKDTYENRVLNVGEKLTWNTGSRKRHADDYCIGQCYAILYMKHKNEAMIAKWKKQADEYILALPYNESLAWRNNIYDREWAWCDALFMGPPALAYLSTATGNPDYLNKAIKLWWKTTDYLYDPNHNLFIRDSSFFTQTEANGERIFWSRGNGWVVAGLIRLLENTPESHPDRNALIQLFIQMTKKIATIQQPSGAWNASLLAPLSYPIKETSGTSFHCYALAWGINNGFLSKEEYLPIVKGAWKSLVLSIDSSGKLTHVQPPGSAPNTHSESDTAAYGVGAFLLAGTEVYKLAENKESILSVPKFD